MNSFIGSLSENSDGVNIKLQKTAKKFAWFMERNRPNSSDDLWQVPEGIE